MARRMIVYVDGTERRVVESPFTRSTGQIPDMFTGEKITLDVVPLREIEKGSATAYEIDDSYNSDTFKVGVGVVDDPPVSGSYKITYKTDTSIELNYNATASQIQNALNDASMTDLLGDSPSGVTVTGTYETGYRITWAVTGAVDDFGSDEVNLLPESVVAFTQERAGATGVKEVVMMRLMKKQAGLTTSASTIPTGSMAVTQITAGSRKTREIFDITCVADTAPVAQREEAKAVAVGGAYHVATLTTVADVADSLDGKYFVLYDDEGSVAFWIDTDNSGTTIPTAAAALDRSVEITTITTGDSDGVVANLVAAAINNDSKFSATHDGNVVTITYSTIGAHGAAAAGTSGFTAATVTTGADTDNYDGTYFYLTALNSDGNEEVHAWYFSQDGTTDPPSAALALDSDLQEINYGTTDTAKEMASTIANAINTNTAFTAVASGTEIHVTHVVAGDVSDMNAGDSPLTSLSVTQNGSDSTLDGKHFIAYETDGEGGEQSRAFWFNVSGNASPSGSALTADRTTEITTIRSGAKAHQVAAAVTSAINALDGFTAIAKGTKINVESSEGYAFTDASAETSGFTVTKIQDGGNGSDASELVEVSFSEQAIGGVYTLAVDTGGGAQTTAGISWDATPEQVIAALEQLPNVAANDVTVEGGLGGDLRIGFRNNLSDRAITVSVDYAAIKWIEGKRFTLDLNTTSAFSLLYGLDSLECILEIEATQGSAYTVKLVHAPVIVRNGLIDSTALSPSPQLSWYTQAEVDALIIHHEKTITSLTGGTSADLDSIVTTTITPDRAVFFRDADSGEYVIYVLRAGTNSESSPTIILPDDYNASTNAKYWERVDLKIDHGSLTGLGDDDHTQYLLVDGTRAGTGIQELLGLNFTNAATLTLSTGAAARTQTLHTIAAESGTADDLTSLTGGAHGDLLIVQADAGDTITIKHNTGSNQFHLTAEADLAISGNDVVAFIHNGTLWAEIGNAAGSGGGGTGDVTYREDLTGLIGGTAADLDSVTTVGVAVGTCVEVDAGGLALKYKLVSKATNTAQAFTANFGTNTFTDVAHKVHDHQRVRVSSTGTLPTGLSSSTLYYLRRSVTSANEFLLSTTFGGSAVNITDNGSGTHSYRIIETPFFVEPADYAATTNEKHWELVAPWQTFTFEAIGPTTDHTMNEHVLFNAPVWMRPVEVQCDVQSLSSGTGATELDWNIECEYSTADLSWFAANVSQDALSHRAVSDDGKTWNVPNGGSIVIAPLKTKIEFLIVDTGGGTTDGKGAVIHIRALYSHIGE